MGCCKSNFDLKEEVLITLDNINLHDPRLTQTEDGFGDLSLDSHQGDNYDAIFETSKTRLCDSQLYCTRSTSISLHRTDLEIAFLQSSGILRRNTLDFAKIEINIHK